MDVRTDTRRAKATFELTCGHRNKLNAINKAFKQAETCLMSEVKARYVHSGGQTHLRKRNANDRPTIVSGGLLVSVRSAAQIDAREALVGVIRQTNASANGEYALTVF